MMFKRSHNFQSLSLSIQHYVINEMLIIKRKTLLLNEINSYDCKKGLTLLTIRYDLKSQGSSSNKGLAWVAVLCESQSVSIVEDDFDFVILTVAAHELGHR